MNCREYLEYFLTAHADGELGAEEFRAAGEHLAGCPGCRQRLESERALKRLVHDRIPMFKAPAEVRARIRWTLEHDSGWKTRTLGSLRRPWVWAPAATLAAAAAVLAIVLGGIWPVTPVPVFDRAIERYASFEEHFEPNVPSNSYEDVSENYLIAHMPPMLWNFNPLGFKLEGGRIDTLPDGTPVTYTFYRNAGATILCTRFKTKELDDPPDAKILQGHLMYRYKGYSIAWMADPDRHMVCMLISRIPLRQFADEIAYVEG